MLTRHPKKMVKPGQWVIAKVPQYLRDKSEDLADVEAVSLTILPEYAPTDQLRNHFRWYYRPAYRYLESVRQGTFYTHRQHRLKEGREYQHLGYWDFGLIETAYDRRVRYSKSESDDWYSGKGGFLYEPGSDEPDECPGPDYSLYQCDRCCEWVDPWSNDDGDLICPRCEVTGLIMEDETADYLEQVREVAHKLGLSTQLERQLCFLSHGWAGGRAPTQTWLGKDFAPYSFGWCVYRLNAENPQQRAARVINGGFIYQGPSVPADGSFPSLTCDLGSLSGQPRHGWFCHT